MVTTSTKKPRSAGTTGNPQAVKPARKAVRSRPSALASSAAHAAANGHDRTPLVTQHAASTDATSNDGNLVKRGQDLLSQEAGGLATVVAIAVGAALIEIELIPGLVIGAGAILLGKLFPQLGSHVRPVLKSTVNAGFSVAQKVREVMAEANEQAHDLVAEVRHERQTARTASTGHEEVPAPRKSAPAPAHTGPLQAVVTAH